MKRAAGREFGVDRQRGFWLRYFLSVAVLLAAVSGSFPVKAQVDCVSPAKISVSRVRGRVFDFTGAPISGAALTLSPEAGQPQQTKTDANGRFDFRTPAGTYTLKGEAAQPLEVSNIKLIVGKDLWNTVRPSTLYVIFGIRWMFCAWATTSHREFQYEIGANRKRIEDSAQRNATQK